MSVVQNLEGLRASVPGCTVVAFGDLRTRLVLVSSFAQPRPQEHLDEMCNQAAACFQVADMDAARASPDNAPGYPTNESMLLTPTETRVFVRSASEDTDVLCCVCQTPADAGALATAAHAAMRQLSGAA